MSYFRWCQASFIHTFLIVLAEVGWPFIWRIFFIHYCHHRLHAFYSTLFPNWRRLFQNFLYSLWTCSSSLSWLEMRVLNRLRSILVRGSKFWHSQPAGSFWTWSIPHWKSLASQISCWSISSGWCVCHSHWIRWHPWLLICALRDPWFFSFFLSNIRLNVWRISPNRFLFLYRFLKTCWKPWNRLDSRRNFINIFS